MDDAANIATIDGKGRMRPSQRGHAGKKREKLRDGKFPLDKKDWKTLWSEGTDAVMDVPLGGVCEVLYGDGRDEAVDDEDT